VRPEEQHVKAFLEAVLSGASAIFASDQSNGQCDFILLCRDGSRALLEVTLSTDVEMERVTAAIRGRSGEGMFVQRLQAEHDWHVTPFKSANIRRVRSNIDRALAAVEASGISDFYSEHDRYKSPAIANIEELGIEAGVHMRWNPPGRIGIGMPGDGGWLGGENIISCGEAEAGKLDNRRKLATSEGAPSHLFVVLDRHEHLGRMSLLRGLVPERPPILPAEIKQLWVGTPTLDRRGFVAVTSHAHGPWVKHGPISLPPWAQTSIESPESLEGRVISENGQL